MLLETIFDDLYDIGRSIDKVFSGYSPRRFGTYKWPETNVYENHDDYIVVSKLPGVDKKDVNITLKDNALKISGERKKDKLEKSNLYIDERFSGTFERNFMLGEKVDADKISAEMKNGILIVKLPKSPETKPKSINIK